jgi:hypothetical protein
MTGNATFSTARRGVRRPAVPLTRPAGAMGLPETISRVRIGSTSLAIRRMWVQAPLMSLENLESELAFRKETLIEELKLVHNAISQAKSRDDANAEWAAKFKKWHDELHALIEAIPKKG